MFRKLAILFIAALFAVPVWADQQKPLQTIEEAYGLMLNMITDYPADIKDMAIHFPNMTAKTNLRVDQLATKFDLPKEDIWRNNITITDTTKGGNLDIIFNNLVCMRIGQPTLAHYRQIFFTDGNTEKPEGIAGARYALIKLFAGVPDEAVAMQMCILITNLPLRKTEAALYQDILAAIGDDFSDTESAERMRRQRDTNPDKYVSYSFNGRGGLRLNGAVVTSMRVTIRENDVGTGTTPLILVAKSYLMPFIS